MPDLENDFRELKDLPEISWGAFSKWHGFDIPMVLASGILGGVGSALLKDWFDSFHQSWSTRDALHGGHAGEIIDKVPDWSRPGGFGHRWLHGHNLLNPFEIDWTQYKEIAASSGTILPLWMKAGFYWLRHLLQDCFSAEGLPFPGLPFLGESLNPSSNHMLLQQLGTIKIRDLAGSAITNLLMTGYLCVTTEGTNQIVKGANYRVSTLMLGANVVNLMTGLLVPMASKSLNLSAIPVIGYYFYRLVQLEMQINKELKVRDIVLNENEATLQYNLNIVARNKEELQKMLLQLSEYHKQVNAFYHQVNQRHETLINRINQLPDYIL